MRYKGKIKELNQIIVSDPSYGEDTWGRYERTDMNKKNMDISIVIDNYSDEIQGIQVKGVEFHILISNPKRNYKLMEDGSFTHYAKNSIISTDIAVDTACVALGINEFTADIRGSREEWQPSLSLKTLADGIFGTVKEGKLNGRLDFIAISGYLDEDTGYSIDDVLNYISTHFEVTDLYKEINGTKFPIMDNEKDITDDIF